MIDVDEVFATDERHKQTPSDEKYREGVGYVQAPGAPGKYVTLGEANVPMLDLGFQRADSTYDVVSVSRGMFFRLEDHLNRFQESLKKFMLELPCSPSELSEIVMKMVRLSGFKDSLVYICCTRGMMPEGGGQERNYRKYLSGLYGFAVPYISIGTAAQRKQGLSIVVSERYIRIPPNSVDPTAKNAHQLDLTMALFESLEKEADWAVLLGADGFITEGSGVNAFMVKDGRVLTPAYGCLQGITRLTVIDLCKMEGIPVEETTITAEQFRDADEIFLTSTAGGILTVSKIDGKQVGGQKAPGPMTRKLHDLYWSKRWDGWYSTPVKYE